jgi:hypothetical protein
VLKLWVYVLGQINLMIEVFSVRLFYKGVSSNIPAYRTLSAVVGFLLFCPWPWPHVLQPCQ